MRTATGVTGASSCPFEATRTAGRATPRVTRVAASSDQAQVAVLGASGYTGAEITRLLALHPRINVRAITSERSAGQPFRKTFPHLRESFFKSDSADSVMNLELTKVEDVNWDQVDSVFCCLPHGTTQEIIAGLPRSKKVVDLSADFRLKDVDVYAKWYGAAHKAPDLQREAVYGLTEFKRKEVGSASLVANPGCYPTSIQLPLVPLLEKGLITAEDLIIDAKSGVSGAGRGAKQSNLYVEIAEGMNSYGITSHRHVPEVEQQLEEVAGGPVRVSFTPHLMPFSRGMQSTIYVKMADGVSVEDLRARLEERFEDEAFVHVLPAGEIPHTRFVRGSNHCVLGVYEDRLEGRAIIVSVIDNLVKGASGQAMQNMNLMLGLPEDTGLMQIPMFP
ncbi:N-acetyl-gamma-glutamyl-phosphate reductase [Chloropicon primus]|uniref:Probable N-acetyl-gamma-glutamyl-phosphate reductase, chloroplastic n=1 Tax=Chloropicon primus TaxID=1764295 RepID=A0A5B8MPS5_9CHLO|nr:N-acetyl-gamma-glutamyl-phosphate reductase [Chloropicon primus]UPR01557.1 N-acetyl-gamma-glutamyl-phosphate reductase [Chloropicon primus]|eukprot:QDZ22341.1 N-acetyl-gamma-glutamyl-phosphate reductase [Chloropicon primus]